MSAIPVADDVLDAGVAVLAVAEVARLIGQSENKVRQMVRDGHLIAVRRSGELVIPADFVNDNGAIKGLGSTITVLSDSGFSRTEMLRWLYAEDDSLPGLTPVNALRINHGTEVKRRAQAMAF